MSISAIFTSTLFFLVVPVAAASRTQQVPAAIPDAVTADGAHYAVLYENAEVRVLRIHYWPA
jgi:hypothetical protein